MTDQDPADPKEAAEQTLFDDAKKLALSMGFHLQIRRPRAHNGRRVSGTYYFKTASESRYSTSYHGNLLRDVEAMLRYRLQKNAEHDAERAAREKAASVESARQSVLKSLFRKRFGGSMQVKIEPTIAGTSSSGQRIDGRTTVSVGPLDLYVERIDDDKISIYTQSDLTWDEFELMLATIGGSDE